MITVTSPKMLSWQPDCINTFINMNKGDTLVICSQRQVGKSFTCGQLLLYTALTFKCSRSIYVSPTNDSSRKFFSDLKRLLEGTSLTTKINESLLVISFINGSEILFRSAESKLRGYSCQNDGILVVDEAYYVPDDIWEVVLPFTNVDNSKRIFISTPKFRKGFFYDRYSDGLAGRPGYHLISTTDYDTSMFLTDRQREEYRQILSPQAYRSEIMGQWIDTGGGVFGDYSKVFLNPTDRTPVIIGVDWSNNGGDNTVMTGFNANNQQCLLEIMTDINDPVTRAERISSRINELNPKTVVAETNSIGEVYISILKRKLNRPEILQTFTTTNDSKKRIIEKMIAAINTKSITLLPNSQLDYELGIFEMQSLKNNNYTYNGKKDDCIMATAFAIDRIYDNGHRYIIRGK